MGEISARVFQINDIVQWRAAHKKGLVLSPKYQRNKVWNEKAKSYLIDTIIRSFPIPPIFIRQSIDTETKMTYREVIDGQQRIRAILEYIDDKRRLLKSHNTENGGKLFSELDEKMQSDFLEYEVFVQIVSEKDESIIYDMFARLNSNNVPLNKQEVRNAKFWGEFKVFIYDISSQTRDFFIENSVFKEKEIARMSDIEFVSSITIMIIQGIVTDSWLSINKVYEQYDTEFTILDDVKEKFDKILGLTKKVFSELKATSSLCNLNKKNYLYTFFAFLIHQLYGLENLTNNEKYPRKEIFSCKFIDDNFDGLLSKIISFEEINYQMNTAEETRNEHKYKEIVNFNKLHRIRTTSKKERIERLFFLNNYLVR